VDVGETKYKLGCVNSRVRSLSQPLVKYHSLVS